MQKLSWLVGAALAVVVLSSTPSMVLAARKTEQTQVKPSELALINALMQQGRKKAAGGDWKGAKESYRAVINNPNFPKLSPNLRHVAYYVLALSELYTDEPQAAYEHMSAAAEASSDDMDGRSWLTYANIAFKAGKPDIAGDAAIRAVRDHPDEMKEMDASLIFRLSDALETIDDGGGRYLAFLESLQAINWTPENPFWSADMLWFDLFAIYADRGDDAKAQNVAARLTQPFTVIRREADNRYRRFAPSGNDAFLKSFETAIAIDQELATKHPTRMNGPQSIADRLMAINRLPEALAVIDNALAKIDDGQKDKPAYDDLDDYHNWALDTRARILMLMGRGDEALETQRKAREIALAAGEDVVSQTINLGGILNDLGKPQEAIDAVKDINLERSSPYGVMSAEEVRVCAYAQMGDKSNLARSLDYMRTHAEDGEAPLVFALLCANELHEVARRLIDRLDDSVQRSDALAEVQTYLQRPAPTEWQKIMDARWDTVIARPDVRSVIEKYGLIRAYPVYRSGH